MDLEVEGKLLEFDRAEQDSVGTHLDDEVSVAVCNLLC